MKLHLNPLRSPLDSCAALAALQRDAEAARRVGASNSVVVSGYHDGQDTIRPFHLNHASEAAKDPAWPKNSGTIVRQLSPNNSATLEISELDHERDCQ
jgi:hypothetical protein